VVAVELYAITRRPIINSPTRQSSGSHCDSCFTLAMPHPKHQDETARHTFYTPSPCPGHYPGRLSTMGALSP
jgi:hypothetical protein